MARMMPHLLRPLPFCVPTSSRLTRSRPGAARRARHHRCGRPRPQRRHRRRGAAAARRPDRLARRVPGAQPAGRSRRRHWRRRLVRLPDAPDRAGHPVGGAVGGGRRRGRGQLRRGPGAAARRRHGDRGHASRIAAPASASTSGRASCSTPPARGPASDGRTPAGRRRPAAGGAAVPGDEPGGRSDHRHPCLRRQRRGPLPVRGAVARRLDRRHQPRRPRRRRRRRPRHARPTSRRCSPTPSGHFHAPV